MTFKNAISAGLRKSFVIKGIATRSEFWWFLLFYYPASIMIYFIFLALFPDVVLSLDFLGYIIVSIPIYTAIIRRLHDIGKNDLYVFFWFIPIANFYLLYVLAQKGKSSNND